MKRMLVLLFLALPLHAEIRGAIRGGVFLHNDNATVGTIELDGRYGNWSFAPAYEFIHGGHDLKAAHIDVRRYFKAFWIGAGPTFISSRVPASETTWNADAGVEWRRQSVWQPFVAVRYYRFRMPIFHDEIRASGSVVSIGISLRLQ